MNKFTIFITLALTFMGGLSAEGQCKKCDIMNKYNKEHPAKYQYYEDYLKALKEKGAEGVNSSDEKLPEDVKQIMNQEKVQAKPAEKKLKSANG